MDLKNFKDAKELMKKIEEINASIDSIEKASKHKRTLYLIYTIEINHEFKLYSSQDLFRSVLDYYYAEKDRLEKELEKM